MNKMKLFFIGAGPGAPDLLTIRAEKIIKKAQIIIYAGSLVNKDILNMRQPEAVIYDSSTMCLEQIFSVLQEVKNTNKIVARIHSGDPSVYGAIQEQMQWCDQNDIDYEIIPGVSSIFAASAALKQELTLPGITQSVIISRISGRTKVPPNEDLEKLAQIKATLVVYLSVDKIEGVVKKLLHGYEPTTPVAVVYRASWPNEKKIIGTLNDIANKVRAEEIKTQAIILVGDALKKINYEKSKLYNKSFSHLFRKAQQ